MSLDALLAWSYKRWKTLYMQIKSDNETSGYMHVPVTHLMVQCSHSAETV